MHFSTVFMIYNYIYIGSYWLLATIFNIEGKKYNLNSILIHLVKYSTSYGHTIASEYSVIIPVQNLVMY